MIKSFSDPDAARLFARERPKRWPAKLLRSALADLRDYMKHHCPNREFDLRFWEIEDDELFFEALGYLPLQMPDEVISDIDLLNEMPRGYRLAFPIFWIEDDYFVNGMTNRERLDLRLSVPVMRS